MKIVVPEIGESIVEATVARWLKKEGDPVAAGEAVVELETDKANLEVSAEQPGVLMHIERQEREDVRVGDVLGVIEEAAQAPKTIEPALEEVETSRAGIGQAAATPQKLSEDGEKVSPVARRLAEEQGADLAHISGSGPGGRVTKQDVQRYLEGRKVEERGKVEPPEVLAPIPPAMSAGRREERVPMSRRRRTIARRLVEAQRTAAMLSTFNEIDMSAVLDIRKRRGDAFKERHGVGLGIVSFFVKAAIRALKDFPRLNAEIQGDDMIIKHYYDIGIAVGAADGLVVPVLRDADRMSFAEIETAIKAFAQKAEDGTLSLEDLRGGTFSITNGGVFGSLLSTPILNPPQVGILGLHKIEERPIVQGGEVVTCPMMYVALSYDHRIVDGREAVHFLMRVKQLVEDPEALLLES